MASSDVSIDLESALVRGGNIDSLQISKIIDEVERNLVKQVASNPRQLLVPFHKLCLKLLDRLFGEDTTTGYGSTLQAPWIKGPAGGWLRRLIHQSDMRDRSSSDVSSVAYHQNKVIVCFSPRSNLLDLMLTKNRSGSVGTSYEMKLAFFPQKARMALNNNPLYYCLKSDNHEVYFNLLQNPFQDQIQHINSKLKDPTVLLEPMEYFLICLLRYPLSGGQPVLTPLSFHNSPQVSDNKVPRTIGVEGWIRPFPYLRLLNEYFKELIPIGSNSDNEFKTSLSGELNMISQMRYMFLMLVAEFWLDATLVVRQNHRSLQQLHRGNASVSSQTPTRGSVPHPLPTDVVVLDGGFSVRSIASMQCVYLLLIHILSDKYIAQQFQTSTSAAATDDIKLPMISSIHEVSMRDTKSRHAVSDMKTMKLTYLPTYFKILQQPLYDMLRAMLSRNDSNASDDAMFRMSIQIWLLYINPWKAPSGYRNGIYRAIGKYVSSEWRPYVAANLHFYTTLAAILLQSLGRVDFSIHHVDDRSKLNVIETVMEGLTHDGLWEDIEYLTESFRASYLLINNPYTSSGNSTPSKINGSNLFYEDIRHQNHDEHKKFTVQQVTSVELVAMRAQHHCLYPDRTIDQLDDYGIVRVSSYSKESARVLVDSLALVIFRIEVRKPRPVEGHLAWRILLKAYSFILSSFSTTNSYELPESVGAEICLKCRQVMKQISIVLDIDVTNALNPIASGYLDINGYGRRYGAEGDIRDRITKKLTVQGKAKFLAGEFSMDPHELDWHSVDALDRPLASYEIHTLTRFLVRVSKDLNVLFYLPHDKAMNLISWQMLIRDAVKDWRHLLSILKAAMRINLRFLSNVWYLSVFTMLLAVSMLLNNIVTPVLIACGCLVSFVVITSVYC